MSSFDYNDPWLLSINPYAEAKFSATFNQAAVGMAHVGIHGNFINLNQKFCSITGYTCEELKEVQFQDITHPDDLHADLEFVDQLLAGKIQNYSMEKRYLQKNGQTVWVNLTVSVVRSANTEPLYFIAVIEDIQKKKQAESDLLQLHLKLEEKVRLRTLELKEMTERLQREIAVRKMSEIERNRFFSISHDGMIIFSGDQKIKRCNPAFAKILGYTEEEISSIPILELIHPEDRADIANATHELEKNKFLANFENRYLTKKGAIVYFSWTLTYYTEQSLIYATARDISGLKRQEALLKEERIKAMASSKMQTLGRMAAAVAHEINNPLTVAYAKANQIKSMTQSQSPCLTEIHKSAEQIEKMSLRIVNIISGLRTLARDGAKDPFGLVSLKEIVDELLAFCQGQIHQDQIDLQVAEIPNSVQIHCRSVQILQVLLNLLNNARDAVQDKEPKKIRIDYTQSETQVGLAIEDNGVGLTDEVKKNLFEAFFTTKEIGKGTGLGLAISKEIVDAHGGQIFGENSESGGARFIFLLPKVKS